MDDFTLVKRIQYFQNGYFESWIFSAAKAAQEAQMSVRPSVRSFVRPKFCSSQVLFVPKLVNPFLCD